MLSKKLIAIKKINNVKNCNENMTKRQQWFISSIFKTWFHLSNEINN